MSDVRLAPPIDGAELRLELILEALRDIRARLHQLAARFPEPFLEPAVSRETAREPRVLGRRR